MRTIAVVLILTFTRTAVAADIECNKDWPTRCAVPLDAGDKAPFTGQLLTDDLAIHLGQSTEHCDDRTSIEIAKTSSLAEAARRRDSALHAADLRAKDRELELERRHGERSVLEHPIIVALATTGVVIALFLGASYINRLGRQISE
jgi:hypothetical protein